MEENTAAAPQNTCQRFRRNEQLSPGAKNWVTMYARMFLGKTVPALIMGIIFAASYLLNFVILRMEDFALMSGTIVLAIILGVLMILTGKINRKEDAIR